MATTAAAPGNAANVAALKGDSRFERLRLEAEAADAEREQARELEKFDAALAAAGWSDAYDRNSGLVYYYHSDGRTSWTPPVIHVEVEEVLGPDGEVTPVGRTLSSSANTYTPTGSAVKAMKQRAKREDAISTIASSTPEAAQKLESLAKCRGVRKGRAAPTRRRGGKTTVATDTLKRRPLPVPPSGSRSVDDPLPPTPVTRDPSPSIHAGHGEPGPIVSDDAADGDAEPPPPPPRDASLVDPGGHRCRCRCLRLLSASSYPSSSPCNSVSDSLPGRQMAIMRTIQCLSCWQRQHALTARLMATY